MRRFERITSLDPLACASSVERDRTSSIRSRISPIELTRKVLSTDEEEEGGGGGVVVVDRITSFSANESAIDGTATRRVFPILRH
jgi:hypothetical protein